MTGVARTIEEIYPATLAQQGFVLGALGRPDDALFIEQAVVPLTAQLDPDAMRRAWRELVAAHEILRTAFALHLGSAPRQVVLSSADAPYVHHDASGLPDAEREAVVEQALAAGLAPFDPTAPPLARLATVSFASDEHVLVWSHHHAILDGWSQMTLLDELADRCNRPTAPRRPARPFGAYAAWLAARDAGEHRAFWLRALDGLVPSDPLPAHAVVDGGPRFQTVERTLPRHRLAEVSRECGVSSATVLVGCWYLIAAHLRATPDAVVGVTMSGRSLGFPGTTDMVGPFATTVPLRVRTDHSQSIAAFLRSVHAGLAEAAPFSDATAGEIHEWSGLPAGKPLYDSVFAVANYPSLRAAPGGLVLRPEHVTGHGGRTLQPLTIVVRADDDLHLRVVADRERVDDTHAVDVCERLITLLERVADDPSTVGDLSAHLDELAVLGLGREARPAAIGSDHAGMIEDIVARAFASVLDRESVPLDADLIRLGGHSLLAIQLLALLRERLGVDLSLRDLFGDPTARGVAARVAELMSGDRPPPEPLPAVVADPAAAGEPFPLSEIQRAYWAGRQTGFELSDVDAHLYGEVDVADLDMDRFADAWRRLIARHPMLRAVMTPDGQQIVLPEVTPYEPASAGPATASELAAMRARLSNARRDTTRWPLFTIESATLADGTTRLFLSFDLLIGDALSWRVLLRELSILYDDPGAELPALGLTFRDYVLALPAVREGLGYRRARDYWRGRLHELPAPPALPQARTDGVGFRRRQMVLTEAETAALQELAAGLGATTSTLLLMAFADVLRRYTDGDDLLVNVTLFNRLPLHPDVDAIVGDFTSLLLVAVTEWDGAFADRVRALQRRLWTDLDHRLYSGLEVMRDLADAGGRRTAVAAPVVFTSTLDLPDTGVSVPGTVAFSIGQTPQVTLDYQVYESAGRLVVNWDAVEELFPDGVLDEMFAEHAGWLRRRGDDVADPVPAPPAEPLGGLLRLHDPFVERAEHDPGALAVIAPDGELTYGELLARARRLAAVVAASDPRGSLVGVLMEKGAEQVLAVLAALLAGRAYVPIEASWPAARIDDVIERTRLGVVLAQQRVLDVVELGEAIRVIPVDRVTDDELPPPADDRTAEDLAYVIFTSGSTGRPKGVMIQHSAALNTVLDVNRRFDVGPGDRVLALSSLAFDLSVYDVFGVLAAGACVVIPPESARRDPVAVARLVHDHAVTLWNSVPVLLQLVVSALRPDDAGTLASLRVCMLSGDWIPLDLPDAARLHAPAAAVVSLGGATEGAIWSVLHEVGELDPAWSSIPYGRAMAGQTVEVLDRDLRLRPRWVPGEIHIGGRGVALGYWDDPEVTAAAFVSDPRTGGRLYRTGDWGRLRDDGVIEFLGRRDDQVKVAGHRVELREVEAALRRVPGVFDGVVVAVGERTDRRLVGFFTGEGQPADVRAGLRGLLPEAMVPAVLHPLDALPLSGAGKVDRRRLAELAAGPAEHDNGRPRSPDGVPAALRSIVEDVARTTVTLDTDLLACGLDSVDVIRMLNSIDTHLGVRPDIAAFYADPTVRRLAAIVSPVSAPALAGAPAIVESPWTHRPQLRDPDAQARFRRALSAFPPPPAGPILGPAPAVDTARLAGRRSHRAFDPTPVPAHRLAALLACLRRALADGRPAFLYPSAGGLYGVDAYVHVRPARVRDVAPGLFYYHPDAADLVPVAEDVELDLALHLGTVNRPMAEAAAFTIFLVTDPDRSTPLYGVRAEALNLLNAGYIGQLLCESAGQAGLGLCPVDGYDFDAVRWLFPAGERAVLLHLLVGGCPERAPS